MPAAMTRRSRRWADSPSATGSAEPSASVCAARRIDADGVGRDGDVERIAFRQAKRAEFVG